MQFLSNLLQERCHRTPFVYSFITDEKAQGSNARMPCCIACINWIRRLSSPSMPSRKRRIKFPIPMDNLLLFMHCPGAAVVKPDQRSFKRMMKSLGEDVPFMNPYLRFCTPIMQLMLQRFALEASSRKGADELVKIWWEVTGRQVIMPDRITARYVRRALRSTQHDNA